MVTYCCRQTSASLLQCILSRDTPGEHDSGLRRETADVLLRRGVSQTKSEGHNKGWDIRGKDREKRQDEGRVRRGEEEKSGVRREPVCEEKREEEKAGKRWTEEGEVKGESGQAKITKLSFTRRSCPSN